MNRIRGFRSVASAAIILMLFATLSPADAQEPESSPDKRLQNAVLSFREVMHEPDKGIPRDLLDKSRCVVIIPGVKKGAFIVGGKYGRGFVSCRRNATGRFGTPAAIRIEGGSYGLQIGGSSTDVFMLIMNEGGMKKLLADKFTIGGEAEAAAGPVGRGSVGFQIGGSETDVVMLVNSEPGAKKLLSSKFTLGADASVAAGPVGRDASANTDVLLHAEILSWSRSRGLFAGLSLEGSTLRPDGGENEKLYGQKVSNQEILQGELKTPAGGRALVAELNRYRNAEHGDVSASLRESGRVTLSEVHFATGKAAITSDSERALNSVVAALKDHTDWNIRVEGFTDNVGSREANLKLSDERANAVMDWLANHGIDRSRLSAKGYGESRPVAKNSSDEGRAKNRRVELVRM